MRRMIYAVLDFLLVVGALACVATIDGGRWIMSIPKYRPVDSGWDVSYGFLAAYDAAQNSAPEKATLDRSTPESKSQPASICRTISLPGIANWADTYLLLAKSDVGEIAQYSPGSLITKCSSQATGQTLLAEN